MPSHVPESCSLSYASAVGPLTTASELSIRLEAMRAASVAWAERPWTARLKIIGRIAGQIATHAQELTQSIQRPAATPGEILASEVLPLAEACRYLSKKGSDILKPKRLTRAGSAWWMGRIDVVESRQALGLILIIGPSNYPLFLNAVPLVQALAAGNAVLVKPAPKCEAVMHLFKRLLTQAGVPDKLIEVLDSDPNSAKAAIEAGVDKVVFTGSRSNGRRVAELLASEMTPATFELSGNDAVIVLDDADMDRTAACLAYAISLNGGQTCIAPRRLIATATAIQRLLPALSAELEQTPVRAISQRGCEVARQAIQESISAGAKFLWGNLDHFAQIDLVKPIVLGNVLPHMPVACEDLFAPLLSILEVRDDSEAIKFANDCPFALGASVFGSDARTVEVANKLRSPAVTLNDVIVPTADARVSFGGRAASGYGLTRGLEGLRELTQLQVTCQRRGRWMPHLTTPPVQLSKMLEAILRLRHGATLSEKWQGLKAMISAVKPKQE